MRSRLVTIAVLCATLWTGCRSSEQHRPLRIGYLPIAECTPLFVAASQGLFKKHGLTVQLTEFDAGPTVIAASLGGSLDGGLSGVTPIFFAIARGKSIKMVCDGGHVVAADHPYIGLVVASDSPVDSPEALKGRVIAVNGLKTIEDALLRVALRNAGIADSVVVVTLPHPNMVPALASGTIDASMAIEPYIAMGLSSRSIRVLLGSEQIIPSFQLSAIFFTDQFLKDHPTEVSDFIAAYNEAIDFIGKNPERAKEIVADWTKTPHETAREMTLPGWSRELSINALEQAQKAMVDNRIIDQATDLGPFLYKR